MERLEAKKIKGKTYYYYSKWGWRDGKCRRLWQKYLGKLEDIAKAVEGGGPAPAYAEVFQWGLPAALLKECVVADIVQEVDMLCPKRDQGLTTGEYLAIASINRAVSPASKRSMWEWFSKTSLLRNFEHASKSSLSSQRFWDHMEKIDSVKNEKDTMTFPIWENIIKGVVKREKIDLSSLSYDGTNFYTFIDTFNSRCELPKRGKNKQGRSNLRQVSYSLFCCADSHVPLFFDIYDGNRNDAKQFPLILEKFQSFFQKLSGNKKSQTTLIFDKGNNSEKNFKLIDKLELSFVGSVKLDEHKDLAQISNKDSHFVACVGNNLEETKAFRMKKIVYGKERIAVVAYNEKLFNAQWLTLQNDISKAIEKLSHLKQKLVDRANGIITNGKSPTAKSVESQCNSFLKRQYMKDIVDFKVKSSTSGIPTLEYAINTDAAKQLSDTYLGKNIIITDREEWDDSRIITAYRSQYIIEDVFKEMKDRSTGSWWPLNHWTDSKIRVHGLYCTVALLLRSIMLRRIKQSGLNLSMKRVLTELGDISEVINVYSKKRTQKKEKKQVVMSKTSELQDKLVDILGIKELDNDSVT